MYANQTHIQCIYVQHFLYPKSLTHCQHSRQGQLGVQYLAQGHFRTWNGGARDQTTDLRMNSTI